MKPDWLQIHRGDAPLIVSFPHTGTDIPTDIDERLVSPWLGRKDADWWVDLLYDFAQGLRATTVRTCVSRTVIDVNRDPSGASLYPGQATTELCPTTTFDGEVLYLEGLPNADEIAVRREKFFDPYHRALAEQIARLRRLHPKVVLYDAHSIRSVVPRLFDGELPNINIGTNGGLTCAPELTAAIEAICDRSGFSRITNGRFKGGWTTRHYGQPGDGVHAIQMELACRGYMNEPLSPPHHGNWPTPYDPDRAAAMRSALTHILTACIDFATKEASR
jgi:N-formylglutamate deformylase